MFGGKRSVLSIAGIIALAACLAAADDREPPAESGILIWNPVAYFVRSPRRPLARYSACTSASSEPSHVLTAMGISTAVAHGAIRMTARSAAEAVLLWTGVGAELLCSVGVLMMRFLWSEAPGRLRGGFERRGGMASPY